MPTCEICEVVETKKWNFPCRDKETGLMGEIEIVCKDCHDKWSLCDCIRTRKRLNTGWVE